MKIIIINLKNVMNVISHRSIHIRVNVCYVVLHRLPAAKGSVKIVREISDSSAD